jgi:hypothetical protein
MPNAKYVNSILADSLIFAIPHIFLTQLLYSNRLFHPVLYQPGRNLIRVLRIERENKEGVWQDKEVFY